MNKDRGSIKWNAMMLPEHVQLLREWKAEDQLVAKPEVDEWTLQQISERIQVAYERQIAIELTVWEEKNIYKISQFIEKVNLEKQCITLKNCRKIPFSSICDATLYE